MRDLRDSKSGLRLLELLKIPLLDLTLLFPYFFSLFVLISRNTSIFVACYRPQDSSAVVG